MASLDSVLGDITSLEVDAVVNAANSSLLGGGGVDGAIHRAAGPGLLAECRRLPQVRPGVRCPAGEAVATSGQNMRCRTIIHTVGPVWAGGASGEDDVLAACYRSSLKAAALHHIRSIAFPAISTGVYGFPAQRAAEIAVQTVRAMLLEEVAMDFVVFCCFDARTHAMYKSLLKP